MKRVSMMSACLVALSLLSAVSAAVAADEMIPNPQYVHWKTFKVGAWAKMKQTINTEGQAMTMNVTTKLVDVSAEKLTLEIVSSMSVQGMNMNMPPQRVNIPAQIKKEPVTSDDAQKIDASTGQETLTVKGQSIACVWVNAKSRQNQGDFAGKVWSSDKIPGTVVKMQGQFSGDKMTGDMDSMLEDFSLGE